MGIDEAETHARMQAWDASVVVPVVERHGGRIVKRLGDGFLVEFASAVAAVACAVEWQELTFSWRLEENHQEPLSIRIGIHLGDVITRDDDIFGNGVNIAARLEGIAPPDGICLSDDIYRHITTLPGWQYRDLGHQQLKNIKEELKVWSLTGHDGVTLRPHKAIRKRRGVKLFAAAAAVVAVLIGAAAVIWIGLPGDENTDSATVQTDVAATSEESESVTSESGTTWALAVLPLDIFSKSDELDLSGHADGFVEDLTTDLAQSSIFTVISRRSAFKFKDQGFEITQIAKILEADYLIEGSFRPVGEKLRINIQFIDGSDGSHAWAVREDVILHGLEEFRSDVEVKVLRFMHTLSAGDVKSTETVPEAKLLIQTTP